MDFETKRGARHLRIFSAIILAFVMAFSTFLLSSCQEKEPKNDILFYDDFDGETVDTEKWEISGTDREEGAPGIIRRGGWWSPEAVFTEDGNLVIRTSYDKDNRRFLSGSVNTKEKFAYGYYETRCKIPEAMGIWAAFWIICDEMGLSYDATVGGAEIDIFEAGFYKFFNGGVQHAIHTGGYGDMHHVSSNLPTPLPHPEDVSNGYEVWHTFALDWQPEGYKFYIDGKLSWETCDPYKKGDISLESNVSSVPSKVILSVEIGGYDGIPDQSAFFGGGHPYNDNASKYDMNNFQVDFLIDYVKVWKNDPYAASTD